jgi:multimeric flavodoxin WrbA
MKIALINGSPRGEKSNSELLLRRFEPLISGGNEISHYQVANSPLTEAQYRTLCGMDALVFAFPLYDNAIPSHLLKMLVAFEEYLKAPRENEIRVYAILNNGFYEGVQNRYAIEILRNWCLRAGVRFGQAIGQGAGEMMGALGKTELGKGSLKNLGKVMESLADSIRSGKSGETALIDMNLPRALYKFLAVQTYWHPEAKKNGLTKQDLLRRP